MKINRNVLAGLGFALAIVLMLVAFGVNTPQVSAQATSTNTPTPTNTATPTPTLINTPFPMIQGNGLTQSLSCGFDTHTAQNADCVQIRNGAKVHLYSNAGLRTGFWNAETGDLMVTGIITASGGIANAGGQHCVDGSQTFTGSATVIPATLTAAGIATPQSALSGVDGTWSVNNAVAGRSVSAGVVTLYSYQLPLSGTQTPQAATTPSTHDYHVCGAGF